MAKLSPLLQIALLDQLGVVDGGSLLRNGNSNDPEVVPPVGPEITTIDTGAPGNFFKGLRTADTTTQVVTGGAILVGIVGLIAVLRAVF